MPITSGQIEYRLSGGAANSNPLTSLGGAKSSVAASTNLFDDVTSAESASGDIEYRCIYVHNAHGTLTLQNAVVWIVSQAAQLDGIDIGLQGSVNSTAQDLTGSGEGTAPTTPTVTFSRPASKGAGISIGNIPAGQHQAIWIRRDINAGAAAASDGFTIRVEGDTAA